MLAGWEHGSHANGPGNELRCVLRCGFCACAARQSPWGDPGCQPPRPWEPGFATRSPGDADAGGPRRASRGQNTGLESANATLRIYLAGSVSVSAKGGCGSPHQGILGTRGVRGECAVPTARCSRQPHGGAAQARSPRMRDRCPKPVGRVQTHQALACPFGLISCLSTVVCFIQPRQVLGPLAELSQSPRQSVVVREVRGVSGGGGALGKAPHPSVKGESLTRTLPTLTASCL